MKVKFLLLTGILLAVSILAASCSMADELSVREAWARPGSQGANSAVYFTIENNTAELDTLLSASSEIASAVELHESMTQTVDQGQGMLSKPAVDQVQFDMAEHHPGRVMAEMDAGDCEHDADHPAGMMAEAGHVDCEQAQGTEMDCEHDADHPAGMMAEDGHEDCMHAEYSEMDCELGDHEAMQAEGYQEHHDIGVMGTTADTTSAMGVGMDNALMVMVPRQEVPVNAGGQVAFQPGGLHVMLVGLQQDLQPGDHFTITLNFEKADPISLDVAVREP